MAVDEELIAFRATHHKYQGSTFCFYLLPGHDGSPHLPNFFLRSSKEISFKGNLVDEIYCRDVVEMKCMRTGVQSATAVITAPKAPTILSSTTTTTTPSISWRLTDH